MSISYSFHTFCCLSVFIYVVDNFIYYVFVKMSLCLMSLLSLYLMLYLTQRIARP